MKKRVKGEKVERNEKPPRFDLRLTAFEPNAEAGQKKNYGETKGFEPNIGASERDDRKENQKRDDDLREGSEFEDCFCKPGIFHRFKKEGVTQLKNKI